MLNRNIKVNKIVYAPDRAEIVCYSESVDDDSQRFSDLMTRCFSGVSIRMHHEQTPEAVPVKDLSSEDILEFLRGRIASSQAWLDANSCKIEKDSITLRVPNVTMERNIAALSLEAELEKISGHSYRICCKVEEAEAEIEALCSQMDDEESEFCARYQAEAAKFEKQEAAQIEENYIFGKDNFDAPMPLSDCRGGETVTVAGQVFQTDRRNIKNNKTLFILSIYDGSDSRNVKAFVKDEEADAFAAHFKTGADILVRGKFEYDSFDRNESIMARSIKNIFVERRTDTAPEKRIELHLHTKMSNMAGCESIGAFARRVKEWGHSAIAITDDNVVQGYPDAMQAAKKHDMRILYGIDADIVDDKEKIFKNPDGVRHDLSYIVFDLETTGFSPRFDEITEIGAVKIEKGRIVSRFSTFVNPGRPIPEKIVELTGITDDMVKDAPKIDEILPEFEAFIGEGILVAHNATFDSRFLEFRRPEKPRYATIDTLLLSQCLPISVKNYKLGTLAKRFGISLNGAHRAVNDAEATAELFLELQKLAAREGVDAPESYEELYHPHPERLFPTKLTLFPKNLEALTELYRLVSDSHTKTFFRTARIPRSKLEAVREDFVIGSGGESGELIDAYLRGASDAELKDHIRRCDYVEVSPPPRYRKAYVDGLLQSQADAEEMIRHILRLADAEGVPVVASSDVRYMDPDDYLYFEILKHAKFSGRAMGNSHAYFMTTDEMLAAFDFLGQETAHRIVIENPFDIVSAIEEIQPIPSGKFPPKIQNADVDLRNDTYKRAREIYGDPLPEIVEQRLEKELTSIIGNGYAVMYRIAQKLVKKSNDDGYYVGSRGSVGSSLVATMTGITEVNPLSPHYVCPDCGFSDFSVEESISSGFDLPKRNCPECGAPLRRDGHKIPFEVFLGFYGDKEPDIDLNFAGEYQPTAHKFIEDSFGEGFVFRAGTIGTLAEKTAYGFVRKYLEENNILKNPVEIQRLAKGIEGVKRTSGQHPGGIMIVPKDEDIHHFSPIQFPADDAKKNVITTHFDYHSISENILKLDILGHDAPTILRMLEDLTHTHMEDAEITDPAVMGLFLSAEGLGMDEDVFTCQTGTLGIPEFGTNFVVRMLLETKPDSFGSLVNISGLSHGTDVWTGNAQELVNSNRASISEVISTREDIMNYLIRAGAENKVAFDTMEAVRKGRGIPEKYADILHSLKLPEWYLESCKKIQYMFPRAHAVAYVLTSLRIAWYKVHYPLAFYAAYFTTKLSDLNGEVILSGSEGVKRRMQAIEALDFEATKKEKDEFQLLRSVMEMFARGYEFAPILLEKSHHRKFLIEDGKILPPFGALPGVGETVAREIYRERKQAPFLSVEDLVSRTGASKTVVEMLSAHGVLDGIPKDNQLSMLDIIGGMAKM